MPLTRIAGVRKTQKWQMLVVAEKPMHAENSIADREVDCGL